MTDTRDLPASEQPDELRDMLASIGGEVNSLLGQITHTIERRAMARRTLNEIEALLVQERSELADAYVRLDVAACQLAERGKAAETRDRHSDSRVGSVSVSGYASGECVNRD